MIAAAVICGLLASVVLIRIELWRRDEMAAFEREERRELRRSDAWARARELERDVA